MRVSRAYKGHRVCSYSAVLCVIGQGKQEKASKCLQACRERRQGAEEELHNKGCTAGAVAAVSGQMLLQVGTGRQIAKHEHFFWSGAPSECLRLSPNEAKFCPTSIHVPGA